MHRNRRSPETPFFLASVLLFILFQPVVATDPIKISFDDLPAMSHITDSAVPPTDVRLSDHFLTTYGVVFRSPNRPYVAVVNLGIDQQFAPSAPNCIGGVTPSDTLDYAVPITAEFFLPGDPEKKAVTDFVSIAVDSAGDGKPITLNAYGVTGALLDTVSANDTAGPVLAVSVQGIHSILVSGQFGTSYDNFAFDPVTDPEAPPFSAEIVPSGRRCVSVMVSNSEPIKGGELGIAYDPGLVVPSSVKPGADFPTGGDLHFRLNPQNNCSPEDGVAAGVTIGWLNPAGGVTGAGKHEILRLCFTLTQDQPVGTCSPLKFVTCLGVPGASVRNVVTSSNGTSITLSTKDGEVCVQEELSFIRGDANADTHFDISDAIVVLGCLFLGDVCPSCGDAMDSNDDGLTNIADSIYLLSWRFMDGPPPLAPFPACGKDPRLDELDDCESFSSCN